MERERYAQALIKRIQQLKLELWKYERKPLEVAGFILLLLGALARASCIIYVSSILALIGLGLIFWGVLFTFTRSIRYVKSGLLDSTAIRARDLPPLSSASSYPSSHGLVLLHLTYLTSLPSSSS